MFYFIYSLNISFGADKCYNTCTILENILESSCPNSSNLNRGYSIAKIRVFCVSQSLHYSIEKSAIARCAIEIMPDTRSVPSADFRRPIAFDHPFDVRPHSGDQPEQSHPSQENILVKAETGPTELTALEEQRDEGEQIDQSGVDEGEKHAGGDADQGNDPIEFGHGRSECN